MDAAHPHEDHTTAARRGRPSRRAVLVAGGAALASLAVTALVGAPRPAVLGEPTGDTGLADHLRPHLGGHRRVAVALIDGGHPVFAGFGADQHREFEIGSVTKTFTGALTLDAVARGELALDTTLGSLLPELAGRATGGLSLQQLATHTSGLPPLPGSLIPRAVIDTPLRKDPYLAYDLPALLADAADARPGSPGTFAYSNFGVCLQGLAVGAAAGVGWRDLLRERLLRPLGMASSRAPRTQQELGPDPTTGHTADGHRAAPWPQDAMAPAGGVRSTAADMARYLASLVDRANPGVRGAEPLAEAGRGRGVGVNWMIERPPGGSAVVWHNGQTGGFHSFCGWVPDSGRAVAILSDTAEDGIDALGLRVLTGAVAR